MTVFASHAPGEVIDAIRPDLEAFTAVWRALRSNYEGTNITRTVARLLHMYQPEEGVLAYERLLRTLFILLEDFDSEGLQLLVSMVPPPKGVSEDVVKEVFHKATGFIRIDAPIFHKTTYANCAATSTIVTANAPFPRQIPSSSSNSQPVRVGVRQSPLGQVNPTPEIIDPSKKPRATNTPKRSNANASRKTATVKSPQITSRESDVFRGFPPSEIYSTQTHVQSIKNMHGPGVAYRFSPGARNFVNFGQIIGGNSGHVRQALVASPYRNKWFQNPYIVKNNPYPVASRRDLYFKTVNNQFVKVPITKVNNFHQASLMTNRASYQEYLRSRTDTTTSGLLENIQRRPDVQEARSKKTVTEGGSIKTTATQQMKNNVVKSNKDALGTVKPKAAAYEKHPEVTTTVANNRGVLNMKTVSSDGDKYDTIKKVREDVVRMEDVTMNRENYENFAKEVRMRQRAIQEDIYKMDVVQAGASISLDEIRDENRFEPITAEILTAGESLKSSIRNYLDRVRNRKSVKVPPFPQTRGLHEIRGSNNEAAAEPNLELWKLLTAKNELDSSKSKVARVLEDDVAASSVVKLDSVGQKVARRTDLPPRPTRLGNPKAAREVESSYPAEESSHPIQGLQNQQQILRESPDHRRGNPTSRFPTLDTPECNNESSLKSAATMAELVAYKKQYYDALVNIQKAKAVVANSLTNSSVGNSARFNPYYYNYLQQQHHQLLQRRQHHMLMDHHRFAQQTVSPWFRAGEYQIPVMPGSGMPPRPQRMSLPSSAWPPSVGFLGRGSRVIEPQIRQSCVNQQSKKPAKRRKLEEIVDKLKESDNSTANN